MGYEHRKHLRKMTESQRRRIQLYYTRKRMAEQFDCKCYECRHFDSENRFCLKQEVNGNEND